MSTHWPTGQFFQLGYVTADLDRAMATCREEQGVGDFLTFDSGQFAPPGTPGPFLRVALAWHGPAMIELIEPEAGHAGIYADAVRPDGGIALHHLGYIVAADRFARLADDFAAAGIATPVVRQDPGFALLYADTRAQMGHFSEFVSPGDEGRRFFGAVPGGPSVLAHWRND